MAGNTVTLEFAGDADKLTKASKKASADLDDVGKSAGDSSGEMDKTGKSSADLLDKFSKMGQAVSGAGDAIDSASGLLDDFTQIQNQSYEKSQAQKRALLDVSQAQEDYNQAIRDSKQATIDAGQSQIDKQQADLDASAALKQAAADAKEFGKGSQEVKQDLLDYKQAQLDAKQATEDGAQAVRDGNQATIDAKGAQLDLNDAQREAHPPEVEKWSQQLQSYAPLLTGLVGLTGLVSAAQWAWNAAQLASPTTWIIAGIVALVAGIVLLVKNWDKVKAAGEAAWKGIKSAASATLDWLKKVPGWIEDAFSGLGNALLGPFKWAFNHIADAWNNTIGSLSWSVPSWIPGIGGNTISVPHIQHFHEGGRVPGVPGGNVLAMLQGGEEVSPVSGGGGPTVQVTVLLDKEVLVRGVASEVRRQGGSPGVLQLKIGTS
jgi:hypothetical protein